MAKFLFDSEKRARWIQFLHSLNPDINPEAVQLMEEMRQVAHSLYQIRENSVNEAGISYAKFRILMILMLGEEIEGCSELNPSEISRRQGVSRNTISALIRDLEDEGLIARHLDEQDRRKFNIRLTEAGRARVHNHLRQHLHAIDTCFHALTHEEKNTLSRLLHKINLSVTAVKTRQTAVTGAQKSGA